MTRQPEMGMIPNAVQGEIKALEKELDAAEVEIAKYCLLYTSPSPRDRG